jgi:hypothetical protein
LNCTISSAVTRVVCRSLKGIAKHIEPNIGTRINGRDSDLGIAGSDWDFGTAVRDRVERKLNLLPI